MNNWKNYKAVKDGVKEAVLEYLKTKVKDNCGRDIELGEKIICEVIRGEFEEMLRYRGEDVIHQAVRDVVRSYLMEFGMNR
ncbi:hypothetical protein Metvu_0595 [Methanocaldococcus vulcanius M7]|uniref:Uncharacterized protein n=1 Tax=Methanocaldococcus vulcanius (strain ATCC 700851 / DSM 12094 / M7) TaxID=579137 RepID=C9RFV2_METVM|nr:hypothetical protein [Methanocaldococcus vulcanius]ACX72454.1 hypothetical protein Metvu_0595 [Methanocaldococcus vulcanius M7]